jgi:hypothetical protein
MACHPSFRGKPTGGLQSRPSWTKREALFPKIIRAKEGGSMVQVAEHLPSKHKAKSTGSNPNTAKKECQELIKP